jgi:signal transduction histidine kinase
MERGRGASHMDARIRPAHMGLAQIEADGALTDMNPDFARLFGIDAAGGRPRSVSELPEPVNECWRELVEPVNAACRASRWSVVVDRRSLDVVGIASTREDQRPVVQLLVSEAPSERDAQSLSGLAERARLAREIHDGLAQDLWLAKMTAAKLARHPSLDAAGRSLCDELLRSIDSGLAEARTAVLSMRPHDDGIVTLSELVERHIEEFADRFAIRVDAYVQEIGVVPPRVSVEILRILQEALNNIRKHASARRIVVRLRDRRGAIVLSVRDDGIGFDTAIVERGFGRQSMHERAQSIGARLKITSVPGRGTTVTLRVPASQLVDHR